ncbi:MAG TPA: hypothetical protein V6C88_10055 [Chroococcidiopsis sp.]
MPMQQTLNPGMNILKQTETYLQLRDSAWGWALTICCAGLIGVFVGMQGLSSGIRAGQVMGAGMLLAGCTAIAVAGLGIECSQVWTFDKSIGTLTVKRYYALRTQTLRRSLYEICGVDVTEDEDADRMAHYYVTLVLQAGDRMPLRSTINNPNRHDREQLASRIRQFLNLPSTG